MHRYGLDAGRREEPQRFVDVEQRRVFQAEARADAPDGGQQPQDVGRTLFEPDEFAPRPAAAGGVGRHPVEPLGRRSEVLLGRSADHLHVRGAQQPQVAGRDGRQHGIAFERHDAPEAAAQRQRVDAQPAGQIERRVARRLLVCGARLARRLFEGARRQDAACGVVGGEFRAGAFEVFDLRGHQRGVGRAPVERHGQRIAAEILLHGAPHVVAAQRIELFACHAGKVTDFSATDGMPRG